jgi:hypothetical protein
MRKLHAPAAANPAEYLAGLGGWQKKCVTALRFTVRTSAPKLHETIKWGHLVYFSNGPVFLIRAEEKRVLFGFWRGKRLMGIEPRLKGGGKYEMATLELHEDTPFSLAVARRLAKTAIELNRKLGDPTGVVRRAARSP